MPMSISRPPQPLVYVWYTRASRAVRTRRAAGPADARTGLSREPAPSRRGADLLAPVPFGDRPAAPRVPCRWRSSGCALVEHDRPPSRAEVGRRWRPRAAHPRRASPPPGPARVRAQHTPPASRIGREHVLQAIASGRCEPLDHGRSGSPSEAVLLPQSPVPTSRRRQVSLAAAAGWVRGERPFARTWTGPGCGLEDPAPPAAIRVRECPESPGRPGARPCARVSRSAERRRSP